MKTRISLDTVGITASLVCAIHCALLPLFLTSLPLFGINIIHNIFFETGMVVFAFFIGSYSFYHGYHRHHHNFLPFILFGLGMCLLIAKLFLIQYDTWLLLPAVTLIISAHILNFRFCRIHDHAHADDCDHQ